jgi:hypothetical protein
VELLGIQLSHEVQAGFALLSYKVTFSAIKEQLLHDSLVVQIELRVLTHPYQSDMQSRVTMKILSV